MRFRRRALFALMAWGMLSGAAMAGGAALLSDDFEDGAIASAWKTMRMEFVEADGRLNVVSKPRSGFNYGHWGNGRSAAVFTHIGDREWKDYRLELDVFAGGPGEFNPHGIQDCVRGGSNVYFRTQNYVESWNDPEDTSYVFGLNRIPDHCEGKAEPEWELGRMDGWYVQATQGYCGSIGKNYFIADNGFSSVVTGDVEGLWSDLVQRGYLSERGAILDKLGDLSDPSQFSVNSKYQSDEGLIYRLLKYTYCKQPGTARTLVKGQGNPWKDGVSNHLVIEAVKNHIRIWVNGEPAIDYTDDGSNYLAYGGVGVVWAWENTGWIDNVVVTNLSSN